MLSLDEITPLNEYRIWTEEEYLNSSNSNKLQWSKNMDFLFGVTLPYDEVVASFSKRNYSSGTSKYYLNPDHPNANQSSWKLFPCFIRVKERNKPLIKITSIL